MPKKIPADYYDEKYFTVKGVKGWYDKSAFQLDNIFHRQISDIIVEILESKHGKLLELGCALGNVLYWLNNIGLDAYGIDISDYAVKNSYVPDKVKKSDITEGIPFEDGFFDYVFSRETLEHIDEYYIGDVIKEIHRILKPGGKGLISTANNFLDKEAKKQQNGNVNKDESHLCVKSPYWWVKRFEEHGFMVNYEKSLYAMCLPLPEKYCWTMIKITKKE